MPLSSSSRPIRGAWAWLSVLGLVLLACGGRTNELSAPSHDGGIQSGLISDAGTDSGTAAPQCVGACCAKPGQTTGPVSTDSGQCFAALDLVGPASACGLDAGVVFDGFCDSLCPLPSAPTYLLGCSLYDDTSGDHVSCQYGGPCGN